MMEGNRTTARVHCDRRAEQIAAGGACHWEIPQGACALAALNEAGLDFLLDDKLGNYRRAFRHSHVREISKTDLVTHVPFSVPNATQDALCVPPELYVLAISTLTCDGVETWCELSTQRRTVLLDVGDASPTKYVGVN